MLDSRITQSFEKIVINIYLESCITHCFCHWQKQKKKDRKKTSFMELTLILLRCHKNCSVEGVLGLSTLRPQMPEWPHYENICTCNLPVSRILAKIIYKYQLFKDTCYMDARRILSDPTLKGVLCSFIWSDLCQISPGDGICTSCIWIQCGIIV